MTFLPVQLKSYVIVEGAGQDITVFDLENATWRFIRTAQNTRNFHIRGFTIENNYNETDYYKIADWAPIVLIGVHESIIENLTFRNNLNGIHSSSSSNDLSTELNQHSEITLRNLLFENNMGSQLRLMAYQVNYENIIITGNRRWNQWDLLPPGLHTNPYSAPPPVYPFTFDHPDMYRQNHIFTNMILHDNETSEAIHFGSKIMASIINSTIVNNFSFPNSTQSSRHIFVFGADTNVHIYNSVFDSNSSNLFTISGVTQSNPLQLSSSMHFTNVFLPGGQTNLQTSSSNLSHFHWNDGNIVDYTDPMHIYNGIPIALHEDSPLIDAGTQNIPNFTLPETDVFGNPRIIGDSIDMGAIQFQGDRTVFTATPLRGYAPLTVQFTDNSTGDISSRAWDFNNDGTTDTTEQNPEFTYIEPGIYSVRLSLNAGVRDRLRQDYIVVLEPIVVNFDAEPTGGDVPLTVQFNDLSIGDITSWAWDFNNDGTIDSNEQNPVFTYTEAGRYSVRLSVNDGEFELVMPDMIYASPVSDIDDVLIPQITSLSEAFPNPFNPETTISYTVRSAESGLEHVSIEVFNIKGQKVRTLVDSPHQSGYYSVVWNGRDEVDREVASGVYLYRMKVGNFTETKRMILMK
jgi:PKD repeat protein